MKNKISKIVIEHAVDEFADTSFLGEYTTKSDEWNIDRRTGTFVHAEIVRERIIDTLIEWIEDLNTRCLFDQAERYTKRLEKIKAIDLKQYAIDRNSFEYFKPYAGGEKPGTPEYKKYALQDYERMERLNNGSWCFIGIIAKAEIVVNGTCQTITSGGLWGIESDSGKDYIKSEEAAQLAELGFTLEKLGFGKRAIAYAIKNAERKE